MKPITITYWLTPTLGCVWYIYQKYLANEFRAHLPLVLGVISIAVTVLIILDYRREKPRDEREEAMHFAATQIGFICAIIAWIPVSMLFDQVNQAVSLIIVVMWGGQVVTYQFKKRQVT